MNSNEVVTADEIVTNEVVTEREIIIQQVLLTRSENLWSMTMGERREVSTRKSITYDKVDKIYRECDEKWQQIYDNQKNNIYQKIFRYLDLEQACKRDYEYYKIHGEYPPIDYAMLHGKKRIILEKKYEVELANLRLLIDESNKQKDKLCKKKDNIGITFIHEYIKLQKITNKNKKQLQRETCSICCDNHKINKMITTSCGHHFGTYCFAQYVDVNYEKLNDIVCPLCRNDNLESFTKYH
jgi:hypothetical protein